MSTTEAILEKVSALPPEMQKKILLESFERDPHIDFEQAGFVALLNH